jgi:hypothetical protein
MRATVGACQEAAGTAAEQLQAQEQRSMRADGQQVTSAAPAPANGAASAVPPAAAAPGSSAAAAAAAAAAAPGDEAAAGAAAVGQAYQVTAGSFQCVWFFCLGERHHKPVIDWLTAQLEQQPEQGREQQGGSAKEAEADGEAPQGPAYAIAASIRDVPQLMAAPKLTPAERRWRKKQAAMMEGGEGQQQEGEGGGGRMSAGGDGGGRPGGGRRAQQAGSWQSVGRVQQGDRSAGRQQQAQLPRQQQAQQPRQQQGSGSSGGGQAEAGGRPAGGRPAGGRPQQPRKAQPAGFAALDGLE